MHELSIAQEIVGIIYQHLPNPSPGSVKSVRVKVGKISNILPDSLAFCFEALTTETDLQGAILETVNIPLTINCSSCGKTSELENPAFECPACNENEIKVIAGTELQVDSIELFDEVEEDK